MQSVLLLGSYDVQEQVSSRAPTFENCYIPQAADMEATELGSHAAPLGIYYSTQQTIGVGFNCTSVTLSFLCCVITEK